MPRVLDFGVIMARWKGRDGVTYRLWESAFVGRRKRGDDVVMAFCSESARSHSCAVYPRTTRI